MKEVTKNIGEFLKSLRKSKGMTLIQLQEESGVSNSYLSQIENGKFKPSSDVLKKLSKPLNVPYFELMYRAGYIPEELYKEQKKLGEKRHELSHHYRELEGLNTDILKLEEEVYELEATGANRELLYELKRNLSQKKELYNIAKANIEKIEYETTTLTKKINEIRELIELKEKTNHSEEQKRIEYEIDDKARKVMKDFREESRKNFIKNFSVTLSLIGFKLLEKQDGKFELSKIGDIESTIIISWDELWQLAKEVLDYSKYKVEKFYEKLNDDEHKPIEGDIYFHLDEE